MGDFNVNLLDYESNTDVQNFFEQLTVNSFLPYIYKPTKITNTSKTLIDNIFYNKIEKYAASGNLVTHISDHLAQFLIIPELQKSVNNQMPQYRRNLDNLISIC